MADFPNYSRFDNFQSPKELQRDETVAIFVQIGRIGCKIVRITAY